MPSLPSLVASVAIASLLGLTLTTSAHADEALAPAIVAPVVAPPASAPLATAARIALTTSAASPMGGIMVVLDVLGLTDDSPKPTARTRLATWLQPEPPRTPLLYSSLVVAKF